MAMFDALTEAETRNLLRSLRDGYAHSREVTKGLKAMWRRDGSPATGAAYELLSARTGSLAGVRTDLVAACTDLVNHMRDLERQ